MFAASVPANTAAADAKALKPSIDRVRCLMKRWSGSAILLSGMYGRDASFGIWWLGGMHYPSATGNGVSGARMVGRPKYLMSCELELLSGRPFDLPGCAVSADP